MLTQCLQASYLFCYKYCSKIYLGRVAVCILFTSSYLGRRICSDWHLPLVTNLIVVLQEPIRECDMMGQCTEMRNESMRLGIGHQDWEQSVDRAQSRSCPASLVSFYSWRCLMYCWSSFSLYSQDSSSASLARSCSLRLVIISSEALLSLCCHSDCVGLSAAWLSWRDGIWLMSCRASETWAGRCGLEWLLGC